jgi:hypothetical protein
MIKEYITLYNEFMFNNNIIFFLDKLVKNKRFIGKIEFEIITENKLYNVTIEDLFDYLFIYKKFNHDRLLNIIKKYYIYNILIYEKSLSLFLSQLEVMVNIFQKEDIKETFDNIVKYKIFIDKINNIKL